jgi:hypothetical protein
MGYFMTIWYILCSFGIFFSGFGIMRREKSGNPGREVSLASNFLLTLRSVFCLFFDCLRNEKNGKQRIELKMAIK